MTFLEDMNRRAANFMDGKYGGIAKLASITGTNVILLSEILRGEKPMPAQVWEVLRKQS